MKANLANIEMLVMDVDGVLTDGTLIINADGSESKSFNSQDGHGIRMWQRAGLEVAFLSGRASEVFGLKAIVTACAAVGIAGLLGLILSRGIFSALFFCNLPLLLKTYQSILKKNQGCVIPSADI